MYSQIGRSQTSRLIQLMHVVTVKDTGQSLLLIKGKMKYSYSGCGRGSRVSSNSDPSGTSSLSQMSFVSALLIGASG